MISVGRGDGSWVDGVSFGGRRELLSGARSFGERKAVPTDEPLAVTVKPFLLVVLVAVGKERLRCGATSKGLGLSGATQHRVRVTPSSLFNHRHRGNSHQRTPCRIQLLTSVRTLPLYTFSAFRRGKLPRQASGGIHGGKRPSFVDVEAMATATMGDTERSGHEMSVLMVSGLRALPDHALPGKLAACCWLGRACLIPCTTPLAKQDRERSRGHESDRKLLQLWDFNLHHVHISVFSLLTLPSGARPSMPTGGG